MEMDFFRLLCYDPGKKGRKATQKAYWERTAKLEVASVVPKGPLIADMWMVIILHLREARDLLNLSRVEKRLRRAVQSGMVCFYHSGKNGPSLESLRFLMGAQRLRKVKILTKNSWGAQALEMAPQLFKIPTLTSIILRMNRISSTTEKRPVSHWKHSSCLENWGKKNFDNAKIEVPDLCIKRGCLLEGYDCHLPLRLLTVRGHIDSRDLQFMSSKMEGLRWFGGKMDSTERVFKSIFSGGQLRYFASESMTWGQVGSIFQSVAELPEKNKIEVFDVPVFDITGVSIALPKAKVIHVDVTSYSGFSFINSIFAFSPNLEYLLASSTKHPFTDKMHRMKKDVMKEYHAKVIIADYNRSVYYPLADVRVPE